jgi:hypothetical protein
MGKRKNSGTQISLFPFLSILAALIGALVVIIVGMSIIQLQKAKGQEPEDVQRAKENKRLLAELDELREQEDKLRQLLKVISSNNEALRLKMTQRNAIASLAENIAKAESSLLERKVLYDQLVKINFQLVDDLAKIQEEIKAAEKKLAELKKPEEQIPAIQVRPSGTGTGRRPYFVEVSPGKVSVIRKDQPPVEIPVASLAASQEFRQFLEFIDRNPDTQIVFLIRNSGPAVSAYLQADRIVQTYIRHEARRKNFRPVRMPLPGSGELDLSPFAAMMN